MTDVLTHLVVWLNAAANALGEWLLAPVAVLPGWLSATLAAVATGLLFLVAFKYVSNQRAVKAVRNDLKANLLALKLFKENTSVTLRAQGGLFLGAGRLLLLNVVPMLVMALPMFLLWRQLDLWYQARPLHVGENTVVTLALGGEPDAPMPEVRLEPTGAVNNLLGPVRVFSKREVAWKIEAREPGYHRVVFQVDGRPVEKELAVGDGFMRVSTERPGWSWSDALWHPAEGPFGPDAPVRSIEVPYPRRPTWVDGTNTWVIYWLVVSFVAAFCFRGLLRVNL
jgi:hypothetical protein